MKAKISPRITLENRTKLEEVIPLSTPYILFVDPSSSCNSKCKFCPTGNSQLIKNTGRWQGQMNLNLFHKIIDDLNEFDKPLKVLRLYKDGEPLLNRNLHKMIKYAKKSGKVNYIDTTTNGILINDFRSIQLIDAGIDKINISVNGLSDEQLLKFSGVHVNFDKYVSNIASLYDMKENCEIFIKITGDYLSDYEKDLFYETFGDICDRIFIENVAPCWNGFNVEKSSDIKINKIKGIYNNELTNVNVCPYIFYQMSVNSDGTVSLCFLDWKHNALIGDVKNQSLKEIWSSDILRKYQFSNLDRKRNNISICNECKQLIYCLPDNIDPYANDLKVKFC